MKTARSLSPKLTIEVRFTESHSSPVHACSNVLKCSFLGHVLFLAFVNDLPDALFGGVLFAGDVELIFARENRHAACQWSADCDLPVKALTRLNLTSPTPLTLSCQLFDWGFSSCGACRPPSTIHIVMFGHSRALHGASLLSLY